jgi:hypothetical protein
MTSDQRKKNLTRIAKMFLEWAEVEELSGESYLVLLNCTGKELLEGSSHESFSLHDSQE